MYVGIKIHVATFDCNHSFIDITQTVNRCFNLEAWCVTMPQLNEVCVFRDISNKRIKVICCCGKLYGRGNPRIAGLLFSPTACPTVRLKVRTRVLLWWKAYKVECLILVSFYVSSCFRIASLGSGCYLTAIVRHFAPLLVISRVGYVNKTNEPKGSGIR